MLFLLMACSERFPESERHITDPAANSEAAADALCALFQSVDAPCERQGATLLLEDATLEVELDAQEAIWSPGRSLGMGDSERTLPGAVDLNYVITVRDPAERFATLRVEGESAGWGMDAEFAFEEALDGALDRWIEQAAVPLVDAHLGSPRALAQREGAAWSAQVAGYRVHRGITRQRSQVSLMEAEPTEGVALDHDQLAAALAPLLPPGSARIEALQLTLTFGPNEAGCREGLSAHLVQSDSAVHLPPPQQRLCAALQPVALPPVEGTHTLSVVYFYTPAAP
ncbi:MAG: hypothetical protein VX899_16860 [Myxococcota bacterium]|nr:hypothetical protein [Myxococcota bacterium]